MAFAIFLFRILSRSDTGGSQDSEIPIHEAGRAKELDTNNLQHL
jgi:hypothetical protein